MLIVGRSPAGNDTNLTGDWPGSEILGGNWENLFIETLGAEWYTHGMILN